MGRPTFEEGRQEVKRMKFTKKNRASVALELGWKSERARHRERILIPKADLWKDVVPPEIEEALTGAEAGDSFAFTFPAGSAVPAHREEGELAVRRRDVRRPPPFRGEALRLGRFYPRGILSGSGRFFRDDMRPFRVIGLDGDWIIVDTNHPLASQPLALRAEVTSVFGKGNMLGGSCLSWLEAMTDDGPGMEGRWRGTVTDFSEERPWEREREDDDALFYAAPRLVGHVDSLASRFLSEEYGRKLPEGARILDLMSSVHSHLPEGRRYRVTGLGLSLEEMEANPLLEERVVHDLNRLPDPPFDESSFEAVICSLSYEYLTRPQEAVAGAARVLAPGGVLLVGLSNRWFPPKVTRLWTCLHEFERVGLVLEHLCQEGSFGDFSTLSVRGWPRPVEDRHFGRVRVSDPVYVIAAVKKT
jgi:SAM-dependent methyltransferase